MSETVKATIIGTIIVGVFMLVSVKMITSSAWDLARSAKTYVEAQKDELKAIVKIEQKKAKDVILQAAVLENAPKTKK
jgi:Na+/H+-translocating membrane pyrophosphatase